MTDFYESVLYSSRLPLLHEKAVIYQSLREKHIQILWLEQKYFAPLRTIEGLPIHILSPGIWNAEAGPDFLKAHLKIGEMELRGDIEIHVRDEQWEQHQHHRDPRYNQVILHISVWRGNLFKSLYTSAGRHMYQCYLEEFFTVPIAKIPQLIDIELYPYEQFVGSGRCAEHIFGKTPTEETQRFFKSAAHWRLKQKFNRLAEAVENPSQRFLAGMAETLGYKNNAGTFLKLFLHLYEYPHLSHEKLLALGLGLCGFFKSHFSTMWQESPYYQQLQSSFAEFALPDESAFKLQLNQIRPLNHPVRRLALLIFTLRHAAFHSLDFHLNSLWESHWAGLRTRRDAHVLYQKLLNAFPSVEEIYWNTHYTFEIKASPSSLTLLGLDLRGKILLNIFCPLLFNQVSQRNQPAEKKAFECFYEALPSFPSRKSKYLMQRLFGDSLKKNLLKKGEIEQGIFQLHHDFCTHYEASCHGCPFVEHYQNLAKS